LILDTIPSPWNRPEVSPRMTQRVSESLVAALIRIGLLLALVIMLMAENAQAQPLHTIPLSLSTLAGSVHSRNSNPTSLHLRAHAGGARANRTA
jgi:hypothetical protein